jgi:hypothetical protein
VALRYEVYSGLHPEARYLSLSDGGAGLAAAVEDFNDLDRIIAALNWWVAAPGWRGDSHELARPAAASIWPVSSAFQIS